MLSKFWLYLWLDFTSLSLSHLFLSCLVPLQTAEGFLLLVWSTSSLDVSSNLSDIYCLWALLSVCSLSTQTCAFNNWERRKDILRKRFLREKIVTVTSNYKLHESCPFFMGIYPSQRCTEEQNELHISLFYSIQKQDWTLFRFVSIFVQLFLKQGSR